jgi:hypothetical protein
LDTGVPQLHYQVDAVTKALLEREKIVLRRCFSL